MLTKKGIVTKVTKSSIPIALVKINKPSACHGCSSKEVCSEKNNLKNIEMTVINSLSANVGDKVLVAMESSSLLKVTFFIYIVPILSMLIGAFLGHLFNLFLKTKFILILPIGLSFLFLISTFVLIVSIGNKSYNVEKYQPKIIKIFNFNKLNL